jgi:hypothetical protein
MIHEIDDDDAFEPAPKRIKLSDPVAVNETAPNLPRDDKYGKYFKDLYLRKIVRENHGRDIASMIFNASRPFVSNLMGTVGGSQANIYDNANCGSHLDLIENFVHRDTNFFVALAQVEPSLAPVSSSGGLPANKSMAPPAPKVKKGGKKSGSLTDEGWNMDDIDLSRRELRTCCWLRGPSVSAQLAGRDIQDDDDLFEECWLAVAGADQIVHLLSSSRSKIAAMLFGCLSPVAAVASDATGPAGGSGRRIAAITKKSQLCVWNIQPLLDHMSQVDYEPPQTVQAVLDLPGCKPVCDADVPEGIFCLYWCQGVGLLMGSRAGYAYCIPADENGNLIEPLAMVTIQSPHKGALGDLEYIMQMPIAPDAAGRRAVVSKSGDGRVFVWAVPNRKIMTDWARSKSDQVMNVDLWPGMAESLRIPNCSGVVTGPVVFDVTPDGAYIVCGSSKGQVYICDLRSGVRVATLEHKRLTHPIASVQFAKPQCQSVLFCSQSFVWRYDFIDPEELRLLREQNNAAAVPAAPEEDAE